MYGYYATTERGASKYDVGREKGQKVVRVLCDRLMNILAY